MNPEPVDLPAIQYALIRWYGEHRRRLPWRETRDPYAVLVAEFMLQQTQVDRVLPKYHEFLQRFPTLQVLATAPTADVIRAWRPLGYNRRAINLQAIARQVVDQFGGQLPDDIDALRQLRGIGRYTAGAIACFAFGHQVAFIDTNIRRVLGRVLFGNSRPPERQLLKLATAAIPKGQAYDWHQALMDLGATICSAATPACKSCPLRLYCRWYGGHSLPTEARSTGHTIAEDQAPYQVEPSVLVLRPPPPSKRVKPRRSQLPFTGSKRFYRGRILALLCEVESGALSLNTLAACLGFALVNEGSEAVEALVGELAAEGLVQLIQPGSELIVKLPD